MLFKLKTRDYYIFEIYLANNNQLYILINDTEIKVTQSNIVFEPIVIVKWCVKHKLSIFRFSEVDKKKFNIIKESEL